MRRAENMAYFYDIANGYVVIVVELSSPMNISYRAY